MLLALGLSSGSGGLLQALSLRLSGGYLLSHAFSLSGGLLQALSLSLSSSGFETHALCFGGGLLMFEVLAFHFGNGGGLLTHALCLSSDSGDLRLLLEFCLGFLFKLLALYLCRCG